MKIYEKLLLGVVELSFLSFHSLPLPILPCSSNNEVRQLLLTDRSQSDGANKEHCCYFV